MPLFTNPIRGFLGNVSARMTASSHFTRFGPRELKVESYQIFKDMGVEEVLFKEFEQAIRMGLVEEVQKDEVKLMNTAKHVCEEVRHSIRDVMMIGIFQVNLLKKILVADDGIIKQGFPPDKAKYLTNMVKMEIAETLNTLKTSGNALMST